MSYCLLFDIGKVILDFDFQRAIDRVSAQCTKQFDPNSLREEIDPLETGVMSVDQFLDSVTQKFGYTGGNGELLEAFQDIFTENLPMVDVIRAESEAGSPLYLLSNTSAAHVPYIIEKYPVFNYFDQPIYSFEAGLMKPNSEIYQVTTNTLGLDPSRTIYVDDLPENIEAGIAHGYQSIQYDIGNHEGFLQQFAAIKAAI